MKKEMKVKVSETCKERKLSPWPSALALGLTTGIAYLLCAAAVKLWPENSLKFFNLWLHGIDFTKVAAIPSTFSFGALLLGLVSIVLAAMAFGALFAAFYNLCFQHCLNKSWIKR